ncbi:sodium:solute symporter family protein [Ectobacillus panaciterrae]|uniref:sodium:solute symporter family protein n=1 Tax=Ectobacillus panaciterrae TaxID=363872 RepID=UPI000425F73D|nr:sodium:solute symporter [Ectobacillus panaciterrae]
MTVSLSIMAVFLVVSLYLGLMARRGKEMNLEQWSVAGRGFGAVFVFLLMAGEMYTTFTFLGGSGWAYGKGGPTLYIICYSTLGFMLSYWLMPAVWKYSKEQGVLSQPDFFASMYKSRNLGILVACVNVAAMIPYMVIQLKGLGIIVSEASYGAISPSTAIWIGMIVTTVYVTISGIHGSAWTSIVKDAMILLVICGLGIYLPIHYYGSFQSMFEQIQQAKPGFLILPQVGMSSSWFITTVIVMALGLYMWPHTFGAALSAQNENVFRKNAVIMPIYQIVLLFAFIIGFAAILQVPGLQGTAVDLALFKLSLKTFDPWVIGLIGAAGFLTALVPGSLILMSASTLLARNVYKAFVPNATDKQVGVAAKGLVPVVALVAVYCTFNGGETIGTLVIMGYSLVVQLFPPLLFNLMKKDTVTKQGATAGIVAGVAIVAYSTLTKTTLAVLFPSLPAFVKDMNIGIIGLAVNIVVMTSVSLLTKGASTKEVSRKAA